MWGAWWEVSESKYLAAKYIAVFSSVLQGVLQFVLQCVLILLYLVAEYIAAAGLCHTDQPQTCERTFLYHAT